MSATKQIRIALIGYQFMGKAHSNAYRQLTKFFPEIGIEPVLQVLCGRTEDKVKAAAEKFGFAEYETDWRKVIALAVKHGIPVPTLGSALSYFDSYRTESLPQNLLQGQRDYFGAHTYERTDKPRGEFFHIDWPDPKRPQIKA